MAFPKKFFDNVVQVFNLDGYFTWNAMYIISKIEEYKT